MSDDVLKVPLQKSEILSQFGRFGFSSDGTERVRYSAIDPAFDTFKCKCGKPECFASRLYGFRDHAARLYRAIASVDQRDYFSHSGWHQTLYALQMAAGIEEVFADTAYVDDSDSITYCSSAADFEAAATEIASKYSAAVIIFTFLWQAYEGATTLSSPDLLKGLLKDGRLGERGRRLLEEFPDRFMQIEGIKVLSRLAEALCDKGDLFGARMSSVKAKTDQPGLAFAAELVREFRNFVVHGEDQIPQHEAWSYGSQGVSTARIQRFYAVGRLLLILIQVHAAAGLSKDSHSIDWGTYKTGRERKSNAKRVFQTLHLVD